MTRQNNPIRLRRKSIVAILLVTVLVLSVPVVAMQFSNDVNWSVSDFIIMGALLLAIGFLYELIVSRTSNSTYRLIIASILLVALLLIWGELAVGIFGTPFAGN